MDKDPVKAPDDKNPPSDHKESRSDPQMTELDGLKKGGVEPTEHQEDKARDAKGKPD